GFADAAYLALVRHPWTQAARFACWLDQRLFVAPDFRDFSTMPAQIDPQIAWLRINRNLDLLLQQSTTAAQRLQLRIETLEDARTGATQLQMIAAYLGVAEHWDAQPWAFAGFGPPAAPYGFEAELLETLPPLPAEWGDARLDG